MPGRSGTLFAEAQIDSLFPCFPDAVAGRSEGCAIAKRVGLRPEQIDEMYQIMAIANYEDRFVIPTAHRELGADAYDMRGSCGFTFGNGCSGGESETNLFGSPRKARNPMEIA